MRVLAMMAAFAGPAAAQDWVPVSDDAAIFDALADRTLSYDPQTFQRFGAGGDTQFITERFAEGRWAARGGQYCSQWPPSDTWTCYDIELRDNAVKFISADRAESVGMYQK